MTMTNWIDEAAEKYANVLKPFLNITLPKADFKAGANAAVEKLQAMGVGEFDEQNINTEIDRLFDEGNVNHWSEFDWARYMARWQHSQTSALLAARDEHLSEALAGRDEWYKTRRQLLKAEALLRDAVVSLTLTWPLEAERIKKYFSEQPVDLERMVKGYKREREFRIALQTEHASLRRELDAAKKQLAEKEELFTQAHRLLKARDEQINEMRAALEYTHTKIEELIHSKNIREIRPDFKTDIELSTEIITEALEKWSGK